MRTSDVDILIVPGWGNSGPDHWQSRWARNLRTARRVEQDDWEHPTPDAWCPRIKAEVLRAQRPVVLVGHSLGVAAIVHAADHLPQDSVAGAFLVAPADVDTAGTWPAPDDGSAWPASIAEFAPMPMRRLPFASRIIASSDDQFCSIARAQALAAAWGGEVSVIANAGHINSASGHGPWPDGLMSFGLFLKSLG